MTKVGRNDPCVCGSDKKYKHCYLKGSKHCKRKRIEEHDEREKKVIRFLNDVVKEANVIALKNRGNDVISSRIQMIVVFSVIDVYSNYWREYYEKNYQHEKRFRKWYDTFCRTEKNEFYKENKDRWEKISSQRIYQLRNSLVHFFGLSNAEADKENLIHFSLTFNSQDMKQIEDWEKAFEEEASPTFTIRPIDFYKLVKAGAKIMLLEWVDLIKDSKKNPTTEKSHIEGIERIYNRYKKEGAVNIPVRK